VIEHEIPRVLAEAHEGIAGGHYMQEKLPCIRYSTQDYGGRPFTKTRKNTAREAILVRGLENPIEGTRCRCNHM
jgi:hypothetical protein